MLAELLHLVGPVPALQVRMLSGQFSKGWVLALCMKHIAECRPRAILLHQQVGQGLTT